MFSFMQTHRAARSSRWHAERRLPENTNWLPITRPGDAIERAADVLADRVAGAPAADAMRWPQPRATQSHGAHRIVGANIVPPAGGRPLEPEVQADMESSFGHDFSRVRVHSGREASSMAQRMQARAYTVGHDIVLGPEEAVTGGAGQRLLAHELAHVVQYDVSGRAVLARQAPPAAPAPVRAVSHYEETPLPGGRVRIRAWGRVGDAIDRPGLDKKYPEPGKVGLAGYDRWHLAGPDATGAEEGIAYAPKNFNVSKTAEVENVIRRARIATQEQGGEVFFDFEAECRVVGDHEGVSIRVVESAHWRAEVRAAGSDRLVPILNERAAVPITPAATRSPSAGGATQESSASSAPAAVQERAPVPAPAPQRPAAAEAPSRPVPGPPIPEAPPRPVPGPPIPEAPPRPVPRPVSPTASVRPTSPWRAGLRAGGEALAWVLVFAGLDYLVHRRLQKDLDESIDKSRRGVQPWARRVKAEDPSKPVYLTIMVVSEEYSRYRPLLGWMPDSKLYLASIEVSDRNVDPPKVEVEDHSLDILNPGTTTTIRYSELLIP